MIFGERWEVAALVIPYRKYREANILIAHSVVDVQTYANHLTTWQYLFENSSDRQVRAQFRALQDVKMKQRLLTEALKNRLSLSYISKIVLKWGLDVRGFNIFPVINQVGAGN